MSQSKAEKYDVLVRELFELLDKTEETDEGRYFRPNSIIYCSRALDAEKLDQVLKDLKSMIQDEK